MPENKLKPDQIPVEIVIYKVTHKYIIKAVAENLDDVNVKEQEARDLVKERIAEGKIPSMEDEFLSMVYQVGTKKRPAQDMKEAGNAESKKH